MEPLLFILIVAGGVAAVATAVREHRFRVWTAAARALGLDLDRGSLFRPFEMSGRIGGVSVLVRPQSQGKSSGLTSYQLTAGIPAQLTVTHEPFFALSTGGDIEIGDPAFDNTLRVQGDEAAAAAVFDAPLRAGFLQDASVRLEEGVLSFREQGFASAERLVTNVRRLADMASRLSIDSTELPSRLAENAAHDPVAAARLKNLRVLLVRFPKSGAAQEAIRRALHDKDWALRFEAASHLEQDGFETLAELAGSEGAPSDLRAEATRILVAAASRELVQPLLESLIGRTMLPAGLARNALVGYMRLRGAEALALLAPLVAPADPTIAAALAEAFGTLKAPAAEEPLLRLLARGEEDVQTAAAHGLARCGTGASVPALKALSTGLLRGSELKRAAKGAVESIQLRLGDQSGRLTLTEGASADGRLSLAGEQGGLSLPDDDEE